jgi:hypothetical protein
VGNVSENLAVVREAMQALDTRLAAHKFAHRPTVISEGLCHVLFYEAGSVRHIAYDALEGMPSGLSEAMQDEWRAWYPTSMYRFAKTQWHVDNRLAAAVREGNAAKANAWRVKIRQLRTEHLTKDAVRDRELANLAYRFGESGGRLELLHSIIHGDECETRFGVVRGYTGNAEYRLATPGEYSKSKGFFTDVQAAAKWVFGLNEPVRFSAYLNRDVFEGRASAHGRHIVRCNSKNITLFANIVHAHNHDAISIHTTPLQVDTETVLRAGCLYVPEYGLDVTDAPGTTIQGHHDGVRVTYRPDSSIEFDVEDASLFSHHVPRVLDALTRS